MEARTELNQGMEQMLWSEINALIQEKTNVIREMCSKRSLCRFASMLDKASMAGIYIAGAIVLIWRLMEIF